VTIYTVFVTFGDCDWLKFFFVRSFSSAMCEKIANMVQGECVDTKLIVCNGSARMLMYTCARTQRCVIYSFTGLSTPVEMKLKLISILVHMHHDLHSASQVSASLK